MTTVTAPDDDTTPTVLRADLARSLEFGRILAIYISKLSRPLRTHAEVARKSNLSESYIRRIRAGWVADDKSPLKDVSVDPKYGPQMRSYRGGGIRPVRLPRATVIDLAKAVGWNESDALSAAGYVVTGDEMPVTTFPVDLWQSVPDEHREMLIVLMRHLAEPKFPLRAFIS